MTSVKKVLSILFGLSLLASAAFFGIWAMGAMWHAFSKMNTGVQTGIATALSIIIVAVLGYFANKAIETKKSVEQAMRPRKLELYEGFIDFFLKVMGKEGVVQKPSDKEIMQFFVDSNPRIVTFASNAVIEKWGKLRVGMTEGDGVKHLFQLEELLREIRKDLGHTKRASKGDILRLFVNDIDEHLKKKHSGGSREVLKNGL